MRTEEVLGEILGHSDFDGRDWRVGDLIVFEDGTVARICTEPEGFFHIWETPRPAKLDEVKTATGATQVRTWSEFFAHFAAAPNAIR